MHARVTGFTPHPRGIIAFLVVGALALGLVGSAPAGQPSQDGLVNVFVGDDVVAVCVPITVAVDAVVSLCGLDVDVLAAVLGRIIAVDRSTRPHEFCTINDEPLTVINPVDCRN